MVTGVNATANIFASYPAKHLSALNGFVDQVKIHSESFQKQNVKKILCTSFVWSEGKYNLERSVVNEAQSFDGVLLSDDDNGSAAYRKPVEQTENV